MKWLKWWSSSSGARACIPRHGLQRVSRKAGGKEAFAILSLDDCGITKNEVEEDCFLVILENCRRLKMKNDDGCSCWW